MSVFTPSGALISIGGAQLYTVGGLHPERVSFASEARFPAHATPSGLSYQRTGIGEQSLTIEAQTAPHVFGGLDAYAVLRAYHEIQAMVPLVRLQGAYLGLSSGLVVIQSLESDEEKIHPFTGVGRRVDVILGLLIMPQSLAGVDRSGILGFGGFL